MKKIIKFAAIYCFLSMPACADTANAAQKASIDPSLHCEDINAFFLALKSNDIFEMKPIDFFENKENIWLLLTNEKSEGIDNTVDQNFTIAASRGAWLEQGAIQYNIDRANTYFVQAEFILNIACFPSSDDVLKAASLNWGKPTFEYADEELIDGVLNEWGYLDRDKAERKSKSIEVSDTRVVVKAEFERALTIESDE